MAPAYYFPVFSSLIFFFLLLAGILYFRAKILSLKLILTPHLLLFFIIIFFITYLSVAALGLLALLRLSLNCREQGCAALLLTAVAFLVSEHRL